MASAIAEIREVKEIPLDDLEVGLGQVRQKAISKDIAELEASISRVGLLEPIVVAESEQTPGKYQLLTGQRRYLACRNLKLPTIIAVVLSRPVDEAEAKIISLTENVVRLDLGRTDLIDAFTYLYRKYGTIRDVAEKTGINYNRVSDYVKFDQLVPELQDAVRKAEVSLPAALRAQKAASAAKGGGQPDAEEALKLAHEMTKMSGVQAKKLEETRIAQPEASVDDLIEEAKTTARVTQIIVTLSGSLHEALQSYAASESTTQDEAAMSLIERGLNEAGFLG